MKKPVKIVFAILACIVAFLVIMLIFSFLGLRHAGGVLGAIACVSIIRLIWSSITGSDEEKTPDESVMESQYDAIYQTDVAESIEPCDSVNENVELPPIPDEDTMPIVEETACESESFDDIVALEDEALPDIPLEESANDDTQSIKSMKMCNADNHEKSDLSNKVHNSFSENKINDIMKTMKFELNARNVIVVFGSFLLCLALVGMIISIIHFDSAREIFLDNYRIYHKFSLLYPNMCRYTSLLHKFELFLVPSLISSLILIVHYIIFHKVKMKYATLIFGVIELIMGFCLIKTIIASLFAIIFGSLFIAHSLKKIDTTL